VAATLTLLVNYFKEDGFQWIESVTIYAAVLMISLFAAGSNYAKLK
jgi:hypothetical protein